MSNEKGEDSTSSEQLNLKVVGSDGQVVQFKIKRNTPLRKLINAYCDRCRLAQNTIRFMFDGSRIDETDTPKSMDMEDGDTIEVFTQQTGGEFLHFNRVFLLRHQLFNFNGPRFTPHFCHIFDFFMMLQKSVNCHYLCCYLPFVSNLDHYGITCLPYLLFINMIQI